MSNHMSCFPQKNPGAPLPAPVTVQRLQALLKEKISALKQQVIDLFPSDAHYSERQKQNGRVTDLETQIIKVLQEGPRTTFRELRRLFDQVRDKVRKAGTPNLEYRNRRMHDQVKARMEELFGEAQATIHAEVQAELTKTEGSPEARRHQQLIVRIIERIQAKANILSGADADLLVTEVESVTAKGMTAFEGFLLCVEHAAAITSKDGSSLKDALTETLDGFEYDDDQQRDLYRTWVDELGMGNMAVSDKDAEGATLPDWMNDHKTGNGYRITSAPILMPKKFACLRERKEPNGEPHWTMTSEELAILEELSPTDLDIDADLTDPQFLIEMAKELNDRCSGGLSILRADVEVKLELRSLSERWAQKSAEEEKGADTPPPAAASAATPSMAPSPENPYLARLADEALLAAEKIAGTDIKKGDHPSTHR